MKVRKQVKLFPDKALREVVSKEQKISRNWFAWNVMTHPEKEVWIPKYLNALQKHLSSPYKHTAKFLLLKFLDDYKRMDPPLALPQSVLAPIMRIAKLFNRSLGTAVKEHVMKELPRWHIPVKELKDKAQDREYLLGLKDLISAVTQFEPDLLALRKDLIKNRELSYKEERIVTLPDCHKTLLVPHPHSEKYVGCYYDSVLKHKPAVLVTLCSPYEAEEVIPFWEERTVRDKAGSQITCTKLSEKVLYQAKEPAHIRDEKRRPKNHLELYPKIVERRIAVRRGDDVHETVHLHYENWPDHQEAPDLDALELLFTTKDALATPDDVVFVNCKATVGRSGVFFFTDLGRKRISAMAKSAVSADEMTFNFVDMVKEVRRFRPLLSGNPAQFKQILEALHAHYEGLFTNTLPQSTESTQRKE